ncbi:Glycosyl hydrolases family 31 protein [Brugia malayi]|uniref:Glycosyl hydrolases family 31 protein n=2 Tax=Brugia TaxID=6278 RepID=A0A4E9F9A0_BRUMA|nr:Glycosyl hydrolases family 31 protein [Brugia malayi]VIO93415.1 Glycosyl hydrolases family 31 protein [Brugia malayi]
MFTVPLHIGNLQIDFTKRLISIDRFNVVINDNNINVPTAIIPATIKRQEFKRTLTINIGCAITDQTIQLNEYAINDNLLRIKINDGTELLIKYDRKEELFEKYEIEWSNIKCYHYMKDVIKADANSQWYGGPQIAQQTWPLAETLQQFSPYLSSDTLKFYHFHNNAKNISGMERYWLCSSKFAIYVPDNIPLWTSYNYDKLSLQAQIDNSPYIGFFTNTVAPSLSYSIFVAKCCTLRNFHIAVHGNLYDSCKTIPDEAMIRKPIWSTWARYSEKVTQHDVLEFAQEILNNHAPICQLELDDNWATHYGDFDFNKVKFPDVEGMCKQLEQLNIRLTLWVHPFVNLISENGKNPTLRHLFVRDSSGQPGIVEWWQGQAYVIDFTNPEAVQWFCEQLEKIKKVGIFSFKFDAGEVTYLPEDVHLYSGASPNDFCEAYVRTAASFGSSVEVRVFRHTQSLPIFYRTMDRLSTWNNIGLNTLIPVVLNFGLHGYYYNLPDMIGGNGYGGEKCSKELYIRWMQANEFLLSMQFSYPPWQYDDELCDIFHRIMQKRNEMMNFLIEACQKSCKSGQPVIRPLWWLSEDPEALYSSDQFVIDDTMIVAPILTEGATSRNVFLPNGIWEHELTHNIYMGPIKLTVEAPLFHHAPPYFTSVE